MQQLWRLCWLPRGLYWQSWKSRFIVRGRVCGTFKDLRRVTHSLLQHKRKLLTATALVLPISEYCLVVWDPSTAILNKKLERVPNYAACMIVDKPHWISSEELWNTLNWQTQVATHNTVRKLQPTSQTSRCTYTCVQPGDSGPPPKFNLRTNDSLLISY